MIKRWPRYVPGPPRRKITNYGWSTQVAPELGIDAGTLGNWVAMDRTGQGDRRRPVATPGQIMKSGLNRATVGFALVGGECR